MTMAVNNFMVTPRCVSKLIFLSLILFFNSQTNLVQAQSVDSLQQEQVNKKRLRAFTLISTAGYGATLVGLSQLWYKDAGYQSFRFFNDNTEWKQIDKLGHFTSAFYLSYGAQRAYQWCGIKKKKADMLGALTGFAVLLPIEVLDGFSDAYGASTGDLLANGAGSLLFYGQQSLWNEIRIYPKFSFHSTVYSDIRPNVLGDEPLSRILKDYNGQTYWLAFDMDRFIRFPKWLNIAAGYGAHEMVYARDWQNNEAGYSPYRQYYLSLDFDLTGIKTKSRVLNTLLFLVNVIKLPAPALELSKKGVRFHPAYF
jgi:hypothetical protein